MPRKRKRRSWSLAARITALVISVAALVGILGMVLTLQLLRTTLQQEMRDELNQQLELAMTAEDDEGVAQLIRWAELTDTQWALVSAEGSVSGPAAPLVSSDLAQRLVDQEYVSEVLFRFRQPVVLEGRPLSTSAVVLARNDQVITQSSRELVFRVLPVMGAGFIVAILGGAVLARRITRNLVGTAEAAGLLTEGHRGVDVPTSDIPEVRAVSEALVTLDDALASSERRQREFLLSISHELRTPLTAIKGFGEALVDGVVDAEKAGAVIDQEARRLTRFVDDLLELARLEADDFTLESSEVDLSSLATSAIEAWQGHARRLGVTLTLRDVEAPIVVDTDARRLRQILDGLLENAFRLSPPGSEVTVLVLDEEGPALAVEDEGPGLTEDDLDHAFDRGLLRERYRDSRPVGTGLGLSIAARLISRMGGSITAHRVTPGGTRFLIELDPSASGRDSSTPTEGSTQPPLGS